MWRLNYHLIDYLPTWFRDIVEFQAICETESEQYEALAETINSIADNFFFQTMDEGAVSMWEKVFYITPNPTAETLDFRRIRLLNRISMHPPFTLGFLYQKLDELIGKGKWTVSVDYPNYTLYIESSSENQQYATEVSYTIGKIKPAHIVFINRPLTVTGIMVDESVELGKTVWNYKLGSWGLGVNPFTSVQPEGVIVLPEMDTIQAAMLNDTATAISNNIATARVNGTIPITNIVKSTKGNTATIQYTVLPEQTTAVTQLELLNASGEVLTSSPVYVPMTDTVTFKHNIPVEEAIE